MRTGIWSVKLSKEKDDRGGRRKSSVKQKTGFDVADAVKDMITSQYPGMNETDAMRLAVMLTKAQFKGEI